MDRFNEHIVKNKLDLFNLAAPWLGIVQVAFGQAGTQVADENYFDRL